MNQVPLGYRLLTHVQAVLLSHLASLVLAFSTKGLVLGQYRVC